MGARLADPVLPLQTMNPYLVAARAQVANPNTFKPDLAALDRLLTLSRLQRKELREGFAFCKGNPLLQCRYETAGKAVSELVRCLERMRFEVLS